MARIAIVINTTWNIYNFRLPLLQHIENLGHEIIAIAPRDAYTDRIPYDFHPISIRSCSLNPFRHLGVLVSLIRIFRKTRPDIALLYTIHPNVHGNLAAAMTGVRTISNIAGLGYLFMQERFATKVGRWLYRSALRHASRVFFQNREDMDFFVEKGLVEADKSARLPGSGVDLARFSDQAEGALGNEFVFLMACRLLWDKGIREFADAAKKIAGKHRNVRFRLAGPLSVDNPSALTEADITQLCRNGPVEYLGVSDAIEDEIGLADCIVLPTRYREGVPRSLLEAAAMGKPIITTTVPGCRDVVEDGVNGYLCEPGDAADLEDAMRRMMSLDSEARQEMGQRGRKKAEQEFDQALVFKCYETAINEILRP